MVLVIICYPTEQLQRSDFEDKVGEAKDRRRRLMSKKIHESFGGARLYIPRKSRDDNEKVETGWL